MMYDLCFTVKQVYIIMSNPQNEFPYANMPNVLERQNQSHKSQTRTWLTFSQKFSTKEFSVLWHGNFASRVRISINDIYSESQPAFTNKSSPQNAPPPRFLGSRRLGFSVLKYYANMQSQ